MERPASGKIADTKIYPTAGSRLIVAEAKKASPEKPLIVIAGGPMTTVANALISDPAIGKNLIVFNLTVASGGYNGKDAWSVYVVAKQARLVDWATGTFWDRNTVFKKEHFADLPAHPFWDDMKRLIDSDLGQANQLGDGAALVWLWRNDCWTGVNRRKAVWNGSQPVFEKVGPGEAADLIDIPKSATDYKASREEFFRVVRSKELFPKLGQSGD